MGYLAGFALSVVGFAFPIVAASPRLLKKAQMQGGTWSAE
jgi:hypothetical protein